MGFVWRLLVRQTSRVIRRLAINSARFGYKIMSRAVLRVAGESNRHFGTRQASAVDSASDLLSRITDRVSDEERNRVLRVVLDLHGPQHGSQPSASEHWLSDGVSEPWQINHMRIVDSRSQHLDPRRLGDKFCEVWL